MPELRSNLPATSALAITRHAHFRALGIPPEDWTKPKVAIVNTSSELAACYSHLDEIARVLKGELRAVGLLPFEIRTAAPSDFITSAGRAGRYILPSRDLIVDDIEVAVEGAKLDAMICLSSCDKTTPGQLMAAARLNLPTIVLACGYQPSGDYAGARVDIEDAFESVGRFATRQIDLAQLTGLCDNAIRGPGVCSGMGTANSMHVAAEALGMALPSTTPVLANGPAMWRAAEQCAHRIVDMVWEDLKPSDILTRKAFENCIVVNSAIGGSTNAPIHINALARHIGVELSIDDWQKYGHDIPLLVNMQPAGFYLGEEFHRAGGVPSVVRELMQHNRIHEDALTVNGKTMGENCREAPKPDGDVIWSYDKPLVKDAGFLVLRGNLFDSAIMKTSVISKEFRDRYLVNPKDPNAFEGRAIVFEGPEDYHHRIDDPSLEIDEHCMLFIRGAGPIGYPGGAEVVNMQPPAALIKRGILALPCIGDGRQSGTSGSPSILNASPEAAADGGLAILKTGDRVRIDLNKGTADILIPEEELKRRQAELKAKGGFPYPAHQTPWQELYRATVGQHATGACLELATRYHDIASRVGVARDNH